MPRAEAEDLQKILDRLHRGAIEYACGGYLHGVPVLERYELSLSLVFQRLQRKVQLVNDLWKECGEDWNQTFYMLYFRTLGDKTNQAAFLTLARRVPYRILLRERASAHAIEALLLGTSGLLHLYAEDDYVLSLKHDYDHLQAKYGLTPMQADMWNLSDIRPANHPLLRIVQAGEFFRQDQFIVSRTLQCHTEEQIRKLFCVDAPDYWHTHYVPGLFSSERPKRIGNSKANIIGINLVAVFQFAQGLHFENDAMRDGAVELLERLPAEDNRYIRSWCNGGAPRPKSALETQALLELVTEYCMTRKCDSCPVGRRIIRDITKAQAAERSTH